MYRKTQSSHNKEETTERSKARGFLKEVNRSVNIQETPVLEK